MEYGKLRVIVSGGGTGGHIFPAVSIADKLHQLHFFFFKERDKLAIASHDDKPGETGFAQTLDVRLQMIPVNCSVFLEKCGDGRKNSSDIFHNSKDLL